MDFFPFPPTPVEKTPPIPFGDNRVLEMFDCFTMVHGGWATVALRVPAPDGEPYTDDETAFMSAALQDAMKRAGPPEPGHAVWVQVKLSRPDMLTIYATRTMVHDETGRLS